MVARVLIISSAKKPATKSASASKSSKAQRGPSTTPAVRRLMWDLKELQADPLEHVVASPLEGNLYEWHVNLVGPADLASVCPAMAGSVWHMVIKFTDSYPSKPPSVVLCSSIPGHFNVMGARPADGFFPVCMVMLETGTLQETATHQYSGWSSAYTVRSILMQLQALLWHPDMYTHANAATQLSAAVQKAHEFQCTACGHSSTTPFPALSRPTSSARKTSDDDTAAATRIMLEMPRHIIDQLGHLRRILRGKDAPLRLAPTRKEGDSWTAVAKPQKKVVLVPHQVVAQSKKLAAQAKKQTTNGNDGGERQFARSAQAAIDHGNAGLLAKLPTELLLQVLGDPCLRMRDVFRLSSTCRYLHWACAAADVWHRFASTRSGLAGLAHDWRYLYMAEHNQAMRDLRCWYTRAAFTEDVLGLPVEITVNPRTKKVDYAMPTMAFLSRTAFKDLKVRVTPGDKRTFTHWMPLYLSEDHFDRVFGDLKQFIAALAEPTVVNPTFSAGMINDVFPKLLNTCAVLLADRGMHASDAAIELYTQLHRVWVACLHRFPKQQANVEQRLARFMSSEEHRTKTTVPALGELVALLAVSEEYAWAQLAGPVLEETMHRNVLWIGKANPALIKGLQKQHHVAQTPNDDLLKTAYAATTVSRRLLAFHVLFLKEHRGQLTVNSKGAPAARSVAEMALTADVLYGKLPTRVTARIQSGIRAILDEMPHWGAWYRRMHVTILSRLATTRWIHGAVSASLRKGYHSRTTDFGKIQARGVSKILLRGETYSVAPTARRIAVEETWSRAHGGLYLDASVMEVDAHGVARDHVTYVHRTSRGSAISHSGDLFEHARNEGLHRMTIDLDKLPADVQHLAFFMSAWSSASLKDIKAPYIRLTDGAQELCTYTFAETVVGAHKSVMMAVLSRQMGVGGAPDKWAMRATGVFGHGDVSNDAPMRATVRQYIVEARAGQ
ncbi:hypothetical protein AMAG_04797 [Allomyces macrogynus ATCC 38327]|uniref:UBC core domain-containing protein n=1 Tax=Allomyces macrogynus (strain ATCC 38327) TaxID=578462 RepID=A0A0L0S6F8_ALLM3|nr:hypothetical protein AMAG_04797 [Allomyces macrogynus ATCC 38327]|eukprot:KNE57966.1 hypothetical protein AMAG_04797 [Allomyces macrogynus ATCC 38327]